VTMRYGSICSGIGGAEVALGRLGWTCAFMSEIEKFPRAVLSHHYPDTPLFGDFREIEAADGSTLDVLVGGPPCQDFSIAGKRAGMAGARGSLTLAYVELVARLRPRWIIYENVPGLLSSNGGRDFGAFIGALGKVGYCFSWRVLDAQYFGVPQRRSRVYVVGYFGSAWQRPAAVLFDADCLSRNPTKGSRSGKTGGDVALCVTSRFGSGRNDPAAETYLVANTLSQSQKGYAPGETLVEVSHTLRGEGFDASEDGTGRGTPLVAVYPNLVAFSNTAGDTNLSCGDNTAPPITRRNGDPGMIAYQCHGSNVGPMGTLRAGNGNEHGGVPFIEDGWCVRRLMPIETERLQAFPDDWTLVPVKTTKRGRVVMAADGPRYKSIGNAFATVVIEEIGRRIEIVDRTVIEECVA